MSQIIEKLKENQKKFRDKVLAENPHVKSKEDFLAMTDEERDAYEYRGFDLYVPRNNSQFTLPTFKHLNRFIYF
jgi:hypothetical protein